MKNTTTVPLEMDAEEARRLLESQEGTLLLDVREHPELQIAGWIPGAVHIPMSQIERRIGELDPERDTLVYCAGGMRSYDVACFLLRNGFRAVANLSCGINGWTGKIQRP